MANKGGQIVEVLSEHNCQGWMQGYSLTGRFALFPSYETFLGIITTMMIQYSKFMKIASETGWRNPVPSINYFESSTLWRQEHNGYSHQDPMFINNVLNMKNNQVRVYFPPDVNTCLLVMDKCLRSQNRINLVVGSKKEMPTFFSMEEAQRHVLAGVTVYKEFSTDQGKDPDVVIVGCGNETFVEAAAASLLLASDLPNLRVRFVNVIDLLVLDIDCNHPGALDNTSFEAIFTPDKPVIFNFHGYPSVIKNLLFGRRNTERIFVLGYIEEGTTTTPFKMLAANKCSRYDVAIEAIRSASKQNHEIAMESNLFVSQYRKKLKEVDDYTVEFGKDPDYLSSDLGAFKKYLKKH
eukprot:TRINITY_DN9425_c0_g1_i1.p2 TRINITY_DN9425_c0_g1~~TRINITY_DN9425_c0_g1_i1.p2  ORF type:complete len:351 (-),score=105.34 TRINITY_DN9425_c0_g1_i1:7-1059(-)